MLGLEEAFSWKTRLLTKGCRTAQDLELPPHAALKRVLLYSHSHETANRPLPEDLLLGGHTLCRLRYSKSSPLILEGSASGCLLRDEEKKRALPISLVPRPAFCGREVAGVPLSSVCSFLGSDLLGITPSNYCFYFGQKRACRFCEILPTFKREAAYRKSFKSLDLMDEAICSALSAEPRLRFLAVTTGNITSYDATLDYFTALGNRLQQRPSFAQAEQVLATLMPPDDLSKLSLLKEAGFNKIYLPLEVFDPLHFADICPGKADYGYERILKALKEAVSLFGRGNVYTNFVYGIQSLDRSSYDPSRENNLSLQAVKSLLELSVIPAFTLYHWGGYNEIGPIELDSEATEDFFLSWGELVRDADLALEGSAVLFSPLSLSNTLFNDGYRIAKEKTWNPINSF